MEEVDGDDRVGIVGEVDNVADNSEDAGCFDDEEDTEVKCCRVHDEQ